ncbi:protein of unknown function [Burkholderia multivorans]
MALIVVFHEAALVMPGVAEGVAQASPYASVARPVALRSCNVGFLSRVIPFYGRQQRNVPAANDRWPAPSRDEPRDRPIAADTCPLAGKLLPAGTGRSFRQNWLNGVGARR